MTRSSIRSRKKAKSLRASLLPNCCGSIRLDIARNRGVEAGLPARVALAEALCLYTPPQVHEAAAVLGELDDSARGRALEDVKSTLEERGRAAEAKALAALCR